MSIDKIIPRFLVSDKDERLLEEGAMTDALNVTISEDGDGSEGVVKSVKGTRSAVAASGSDLRDNDAVNVIGQVSDPQRGYIYFFVADASATNDFSNGTEHAIYQYDVSNDNYRLVVKRSWLRFDPNGFVKADVLNADFQQNGNIQTCLYFTDDVNPPRKINVDRAINGDYGSVSGNDLDYTWLAIKAAPTSPPTFSFETDYNFEQNNFSENIFQYATQIIYVDGEESAISSYSKLAVSQSSIFGGLESEDYGVQTYVHNVCNIRTNINKNLPDLSRIRILARRGNDGAWFVVEEYDPKSDVVREVLGTQLSVYNSGTQEYKFYNDRLGAPVDIPTVNKLYDNVPLKARGQSLVSNRLMYSDYTEGFENAASEADVDLRVEYSNSSVGSSSLIDPSDYTNVINQALTAPNIEIDLIGGNAFGSNAQSNTIIPAGTRIELSFIFNPTFNAQASSGNIIEFEASELIDGFGTEVQGTLGTSTLNFDTLNTTSETFRVSTFLSSDLSISLAADVIAGLVEQEELTLNYTISSGSLSGVLGGISGTNFTNAVADVTFKFGEVSSANAAVITLKPRITKISISEIDLSVGQISPLGSNGEGTLGDCFVPSGSFQSQVTYSLVSSPYIASEFALAETLGATPTFKSGSSYSLGVVYYDKWNRSGFVNELGNVFIDHIATRSSNYGPAAIRVDFGNYNDQPSWAKSYQIVSTESSVESVFQYTVGGAYATRDESSTLNPRALNDNTKKLYVSLKTLDLYRNDKEFLRDYSYTEGDKLRIISRRSDDGNSIIYPKASDGSVIEFDVVGVVQLTEVTGNPIHINGTSGNSGDDSSNDPHTGTFLIIEAPSVAAQVNGTDGNPLEYTGYDWFQVTGTDYSATNQVPAILNYWNRETLIEVVTPRKSTSEKVYYEIGERRSIGGYRDVTLGPHGPSFLVNSGDVHYRAIAARTPVYGTGWNDMNFSGQQYYDENPETWTYVPKYIEDQSVSDAFSSKSWDKGRPQVVYKKAAEIRRRNGITYSDAYAEDVANLSFSSFNPSLANFETLDGRYGAIEYIGNYNDDLVALQENKLCLIPANKNIIEYAGGSSNVAVSNNVLGPRRYSSGDYGSSGHPEAVIIQDNNVYFVDESRQAVCALSGGQLTPISEKGMSSFFEDFFTSGHTKYVSGYDPRDNTYYLTGLNGTDDKYKTVGYDAARGVWQSRYNFQPDVYANQNNMLYSAKYTSGNDIFWRHNNTAYNTFYGTEYRSIVQVVSKLSPSRVKVFNAVSYEGDSADWKMNSGMVTSLGQTSGTITSWTEKEGSYYSSMPRNTSVSGDYGVTVEEFFVGNLTHIGSVPGGEKFQSTENLSRIPLPSEADNIEVDGVNSSIESVDRENNTITLGSVDYLDIVGNNRTISVTTTQSKTTEDVMRGHWAKITLSNSSPVKHELYCINTHITDSKSHHPLGE
jgi:hypothetical protein